MNHHSFSLLRKVATRLSLVCCALLCLTLLGSAKKVRRPRHKKLEALYRQPWGMRIDRVDLSGEGLTEVPCLSMYDIRELDLSHNKIRNIAWRNLPTRVENINLSHNLLADTLVWDEFFTPEIHNLDLSHNRLKLFVPSSASWTPSICPTTTCAIMWSSRMPPCSPATRFLLPTSAVIRGCRRAY